MRVELAASVPRLIISDEMRLVQVISNLLNNAIKFTDQGEVALYIDTVALHEAEALVSFKIKDTGIGIAKENQAHLFDAFSQADISMTRKYGGSGLGLSICQQIVKLLGGEITLNSDLGEGCEFNFTLSFSLPNNDQIQKSGIENNKTLAINLYGVKQILPQSFIDTIDSLCWQYHSLEDITQLSQLSLNSAFIKEPLTEKHTQAKHVLLVNESVFIENTVNAELFKTIDLIALSQPTMKALNDKTCQQLNEIKVPYILLDPPLYRYSLERIANSVLSLSNQNSSNMSVLLQDKNAHNIEDISKENLANVNVLLVEDNLVNQLVAKELLLSLQASVTIANNGQEALQVLDNAVFDVVLMDIQMPIMDGLTATQHIRKNGKHQNLPIIAMTAHAREEDKQRSLSAGMNLHISKPITAKVLLASILTAVKL